MSASEDVKREYLLKKCVAKSTRKCCPNSKRQPDIKLVPQYRGNFSKTFPHILAPGTVAPSYIVDKVQYEKLLRAVYKWKPCLIREIQLGTPGGGKLVNASNIFDLELIGKYKGCFHLPPYPGIESALAAGEMVELYEMALNRDVPFIEYSTSTSIAVAAANLSSLSEFLGPKGFDSKVTPATIFRGNTSGDLIGPYISQFLYYPGRFGVGSFTQQYPVAPQLTDYMTTVEQFLSAWSGKVLETQASMGSPRYLATLRDGATYIHYDEPNQPFFTALRVLQALKVPLSSGNPYANGTLPTEVGFVTLGIVDVFDLLTRAGKLALDAVWFIKWTQLRLRPEEFGYQVQVYKEGDHTVNISSELINNSVLTRIFALYGTYLLPQAYAEGAPAHPSCPSGHAVLAGAQTTILKAWFNNDFVFPKTLQANADGSALLSVPTIQVTVGGELDKLASNCAILRNAAGIHYRDDVSGVQLGEAVAIEMLQEHVKRYQVPVTFTLTKRNGETIVIKN